ncbi:MAG TPA: hypothetical protein VH950_17345 [Gaiellaceae bacterium]|jgi:hypothetical protein
MAEPVWDDVLRAAAHLQALVPDAVLVGGTAAATHAAHRVSFDDDHVLTDLRERFDEVLTHLEEHDGWVTSRVNRPVLILGSLDGIETGIRQLIRTRPLEVEELAGPAGPIRVPTLVEMLRIKAWLVLRRNATRDYLDVVALAGRLGPEEAARTALALDAYYDDQRGPGGRRIATQLARQLAEPAPYDLSDVDLQTYRRLEARWRDWGEVSAACNALATGMLTLLAGESAG